MSRVGRVIAELEAMSFEELGSVRKWLAAETARNGPARKAAKREEASRKARERRRIKDERSKQICDAAGLSPAADVGAIALATIKEVAEQFGLSEHRVRTELLNAAHGSQGYHSLRYKMTHGWDYLLKFSPEAASCTVRRSRETREAHLAEIKRHFDDGSLSEEEQRALASLVEDKASQLQAKGRGMAA